MDDELRANIMQPVRPREAPSSGRPERVDPLKVCAQVSHRRFRRPAGLTERSLLDAGGGTMAGESKPMVEVDEAGRLGSL